MGPEIYKKLIALFVICNYCLFTVIVLLKKSFYFSFLALDRSVVLYGNCITPENVRLGLFDYFKATRKSAVLFVAGKNGFWT